MFAKLFARIAESSLMEESIETRYPFMMFLALANRDGVVVGTDVALARRVNLPLTVLTESVYRLMQPDPASNSKAHDGRRLVYSEGERGYLIVNYEKYRNLRGDNDRRQYMRSYMRSYRDESVNSRKQSKLCKHSLAQAEAEAEADTDKGGKRPPINGAQTIVYDRELRRVEKSMDSIKKSYDDHPSWDDKDVVRFRELKERRARLRILLGLEEAAK